MFVARGKETLVRLSLRVNSTLGSYILIPTHVCGWLGYVYVLKDKPFACGYLDKLSKSLWILFLEAVKTCGQ